MVGGHKKEDYPSKGDFSNFNFYKTKKKKKKNKRLWQLQWDSERRGYENSVKVTIMSVEPNNTKTDDEAISPPTLQLKAFIMSHANESTT